MPDVLVRKIINKKGFTLIEIIATLVLAGIIVVLAGAGMARIADGLVFTRMNAETVQKGQLAATRLSNEFKTFSSVTYGSHSSLTIIKKNGEETTVRKNGSSLLLNGDVLTDNVKSFGLTYYSSYSDSTGNQSWNPSVSRVIEFILTLDGTKNSEVEFKSKVTPRNLY